jgi:hypothetical protein
MRRRSGERLWRVALVMPHPPELAEAPIGQQV